MTIAVKPTLRVAIGPVMDDFGSWDWVGREMLEELRSTFQIAEFSDTIPDADVVLFVKFPPPPEVWPKIRARIIYCPIDYFGSAEEIEVQRDFLKCCRKIIVHCSRLTRYFQRLSSVEYLDHHVRFFNETPAECRQGDSILWTGVRTQVPALVRWANTYKLPGDLLVLTNHTQSNDEATPESFGFNPQNEVRVQRWSESEHYRAIDQSCAAIDIRGTDFRERHKPPTKAMDALAAGLPLAMNRGAVSVDHLDSIGFRCVTLPESEEAASEQTVAACYDRWLSREYRDETRSFGLALRELLSRKRVGLRLRRIIDQVANA